jgi:hypothetical protein
VASGTGSGSAKVEAPKPKNDVAKVEAPKPKNDKPKNDAAKVEAPKPAPKNDAAKVEAPKPAPKDAKPPEVATAPAADEGYLVAYTTPFARVVVDGSDTGKATPIGPRAKIHLKPGKHKIKFVVGDQSEAYTINIEAGKTTTLTKDLQIGQ